jgi:hypothetical protein
VTQFALILAETDKSPELVAMTAQCWVFPFDEEAGRKEQNRRGAHLKTY